MDIFDTVEFIKVDVKALENRLSLVEEKIKATSGSNLEGTQATNLFPIKLGLLKDIAENYDYEMNDVEDENSVIRMRQENNNAPFDPIPRWNVTEAQPVLGDTSTYLEYLNIDVALVDWRNSLCEDDAVCTGDLWILNAIDFINANCLSPLDSAHHSKYEAEIDTGKADVEPLETEEVSVDVIDEVPEEVSDAYKRGVLDLIAYTYNLVMQEKSNGAIIFKALAPTDSQAVSIDDDVISPRPAPRKIPSSALLWGLWGVNCTLKFWQCTIARFEIEEGNLTNAEVVLKSLIDHCV